MKDNLPNSRHDAPFYLLLPVLLVLLGLLAACAPGEPANSTSGAPAPAETGELDLNTGRNPDGTFFIGDADAPVTLTDYSDFL